LESKSHNSSRGYFVRFSQIKAGDVLLIKSSGKSSDLIKAFSKGGLYSHAAIWLPINPGSPYLVLTESEDAGVGPTFLARGEYVTENGVEGYDPFVPDVEKADVYRHPALAAMDPESLARAAHQLAREEFFFGYSKLERLAGAVDRFRSLRPLIAFGLQVIDTRDRNLEAGVFCSELVARYFEILGVPLFDSFGRPEEISPSALAASKLSKQDDLLIETSALASFRILSDVMTFDRATELHRAIRSRSNTIRLTQVTAKLDSQLKAWSADLLRKLAREVPDTIEMAIKLSKLAVEFGDHICAERMESTIACFRLIEAVLVEAATKPEGVSTTAWDGAEGHFAALLGELYDGAQAELQRRYGLFNLKFVRRTIRQKGSDPISEKALSDIRQAVLPNWKEYLKGREQARGFRKLFPLRPPTSEEAAIIDNVIAIALIRLMPEEAST
jgi:hypothetical protein